MSLLPTREAGGVATSMEMTGRLDGRSVKVCEAAFCYDLPASSRQKIGLKNGVWMELELPGTAAHTVLVPETALDEAVCAGYYEGKGLHSFATAPRGWAVFTENDLDAARLLRKSESLRQKLETSQSSMILAVKGNRLAGLQLPPAPELHHPAAGPADTGDPRVGPPARAGLARRAFGHAGTSHRQKRPDRHAECLPRQ